jgi:dihydropteroate synthase
MAQLIAESGAGYIAMHLQGTPQTMQNHPQYADVVGSVHAFFRETLNRLSAAGVALEQIALDVGIGFGKTADHNLELLGRFTTFTDCGRPLLLGVSRKSFLGRQTGAPVEARLAGGLAAACLAVEAGAAVVRTHDVAETVQALRMTEAILARRRA